MSFELLDLVAAHGAEQVAFAADDETGLRAIVAIHSTVLGPGLGGTRFYKHAVCGNDLGGAKAVIIGDPRSDRTEQLIVSYGRLVDRLGGRYLTAEDVGTTQADMDLIRTVTPHVTGVSESLGGSGDPSPATAWGVLDAMKAVAERLWGDPTLEGRHVAIAGTGKVGGALARHLAEAGCRVTLADVRGEVAAALAAELGATVADPGAIHQVECDILSPCALGATINERTIPELACAAVCGCANNQLATDGDGDRLAAAGVLYAPDYVVNAGGVINIADELGPDGYDRERAWRQVATIHDTVARVFAVADDEGITPAEAADRLAERRLFANSTK